MPPKTKLTTQEELLALIKDHNIHFDGPVPPKQWPSQYRHHFHVIHKIGRVRYAEYKLDKNVPRERVKDFRNRVNSLRERAYHFVDNPSLNETTWRDLEQPILKRFDERVICNFCKNELWKADYEARSINVEVQDELLEKRGRRKMCNCDRKRTVVIGHHSDEDCTLFDYVKETEMTHATGDDLEHLSISMKPDRVIGLYCPSRMSRTGPYFPLKKSRVLLPFMIVEAKREKSAPGFKAIQYQTAFPVRRLLKAQNEFLNNEGSGEPCLVWFFAYQGEHWRLYGCTYEDDHVRMYDLWQGTIQSQDDALQLLLIVDHIWSWARDIYRPSVIKHFSSNLNNFSDWSSSFSNRFCPSVSLSTTTSPILKAENPYELQFDEISESTESSSDEDMHIEPTLSLKTTKIPKLPSSWTGIGKIRHSNMIKLEHQTGTASPPPTQRAGTRADQIIELLFSLRIDISSGTMCGIRGFWEHDGFCTGSHGTERVLQTTLMFQTYCDPHTWQIKRRITCIQWLFLSSRAEKDHLSVAPPFKIFEIATLLQEAQEIHGAESVQCAVRDQNWVLALDKNRDLTWIPWDELNIPQNAFEMLEKKGLLKMGALYENERTKRILPSFCEQQNSITQSLDQDPLTGDSMIAIDRSTGRPRFCLFVTSPRNDWASNAILHELLKEAVRKKNLCGDLEPRLGRAELRTLRKWIKCLE